jgi:hypothetical protein
MCEKGGEGDEGDKVQGDQGDTGDEGEVRGDQGDKVQGDKGKVQVAKGDKVHNNTLIMVMALVIRTDDKLNNVCISV